MNGVSQCWRLGFGALVAVCALGARGHEVSPMPWPHREEVLNYHACGCADACWVAELQDRRSLVSKARLRCDCEVLAYSAKSPEPVAEVRLGSCSDINESDSKAQRITTKLKRLREVSAMPTSSVAKVVTRAESCQHLAGEFGGDRSEQDQAINQQMTRLQCDQVADELKELNAVLPAGRPLRVRVRQLLKAYE